jgi:hypothetical protein
MPPSIDEEEIEVSDSFDINATVNWNEGRRVIEVQYVIEKLIEGCRFCGHQLNFIDVCGEVRYGLASMLQIKCRNCGILASVPTGKRHSRIDSDHPARAFDVNTKLALGKNVMEWKLHKK